MNLIKTRLVVAHTFFSSGFAGHAVPRSKSGPSSLRAGGLTVQSKAGLVQRSASLILFFKGLYVRVETTKVQCNRAGKGSRIFNGLLFFLADHAADQSSHDRLTFGSRRQLERSAFGYPARALEGGRDATKCSGRELTGTGGFWCC